MGNCCKKKPLYVDCDISKLSYQRDAFYCEKCEIFGNRILSNAISIEGYGPWQSLDKNNGRAVPRPFFQYIFYKCNYGHRFYSYERVDKIPEGVKI